MVNINGMEFSSASWVCNGVEVFNDKGVIKNGSVYFEVNSKGGYAKSLSDLNRKVLVKIRLPRKDKKRMKKLCPLLSGKIMSPSEMITIWNVWSFYFSKIG